MLADLCDYRAKTNRQASILGTIKFISVPLKSIDISVTMTGFIANVTSTMRYRNTETHPIEAVYEFPMDDQSAVYHFEAQIEDRIIVAECREKEQV